MEQKTPELEQPTDQEKPRPAIDYLALPFAPLIWIWDGLKAVGAKFFDLASWLDPAKGLSALGRLLRPVGVRIAAFLKPLTDAAHRLIVHLFGWVAPLTDAVERAGRAVAARVRQLAAAVERTARSLREAIIRAWRTATIPARWISARARAAWLTATRPIRGLAARLRGPDR